MTPVGLRAPALGWIGASIFAVSLFAAAPAASGTAGAQVGEDELKAAFLYNFVKFVEWPCESATSGCEEIWIGFLGRDPVSDILEETVEGKRVRGHRIRIQRFASLEEVREVQLLFVCPGSVDVAVLAESLRDRPVLTVGQSDDFSERGGIVRLFLEGRRMRFEINPAAAKRHGIRVSSELLALARIYDGEH